MEKVKGASDLEMVPELQREAETEDLDTETKNPLLIHLVRNKF